MSEKYEKGSWYDDPDEVVAFARWYWEGAAGIIGEFANLLDYFEKPWKWDPEYADYKAERDAKKAGSMEDFYRSLVRKPRSEWDEEMRGREADVLEDIRTERQGSPNEETTD